MDTNPLDKLARLAEQRRVKTATLRSAVTALCERLTASLDPEEGDEGTGPGLVLRYEEWTEEGRQSHPRRGWILRRPAVGEETDYVDAVPVDLVSPGTTRSDLLLFAASARDLVAALIARVEVQAGLADTAASEAERVTAQVRT